jgi:hypothetical protein
LRAWPLCHLEWQARRVSGARPSELPVKSLSMRHRIRHLFAHPIRPGPSGRIVARALLALTLSLGGMACSSSYTPSYSGATSIQVAPSRLPSEYLASGQMGMSADVVYRFEIGFADYAPPCEQLTATWLRQGFVAIRVPENSGSGQVSSEPTLGPRLSVGAWASPGPHQTLPLVRNDALLPAINARLPIAAGQAAHWETFRFAQDVAWDCVAQSLVGDLRFTLEYNQSACIGCELDIVFAIQGPLPWLPFYSPEWTHVIAHLTGRLSPTPNTAPSTLLLRGQYAEWRTTGQEIKLWHQLVNLDATQSVLVDVNYSSSRGGEWGLFANWDSTKPLGVVELGPNGRQDFFLRRDVGSAVQGFETVTITATVRGDPTISARVVDILVTADDWQQAAPLYIEFVPLALKPK